MKKSSRPQLSRRMVAFVLAAAIAATAPMAWAEPALGDWNVWKDTDVMDDSVRVTSSLLDDGGDKSLYVRCWRDEIDIFVSWGDDEYFGGDAWTIEVRARIDSDPMDSETWSLSDDRSSTFFPDEPLVEFLGRIAVASRLILRVTPPNRSSVTVTFDLTGVRWALMPVADSCGRLWLFAGDDTLVVDDDSVIWAMLILRDFALGKGETRELDEFRPLVAEAFKLVNELETETDSE